MLANFRIRTGLLLLLTVFALALWWAAGDAWIGAKRSAAALETIDRLSTAELEPLHETQRLLLATLIDMDNAYIDLQRGDQIAATDYTRKASAHRAETAKVFDAWHRTATRDRATAPAVDRITAAYGSYAKVLDAREEALYDVSLDRYVAASSTAEQADATFQSTLRDVIGAVQAQRDASRRRANAQAETAAATAIALFALSVVLIAAYWVFVDRMLLRPLTAVAQHCERIAAGDLGSSIRVWARNEIGALWSALERMQGGLARTVDRIRRGTDDVNDGILGIANDNRELSGRTEHQASALEQTAATLEELAAAVRQNADNTRRSDEFARTAKDDAMFGSEIMTRVAGTMNAMSASAVRIADIVGVIDSIAFQTNILALNASVEAARAREHGRGFAVVASEVRLLAQRSAEAAKEIKTLIDASNRSIQAGATQVVEAGEAMNQIVRSVERVTDAMQEISVASSEQSDAIDQVSRVVVELDRATQQNAALVERTATAAGSLRNDAGKLVESVSVFAIGDGTLSA